MNTNLNQNWTKIPGAPHLSTLSLFEHYCELIPSFTVARAVDTLPIVDHAPSSFAASCSIARKKWMQSFIMRIVRIYEIKQENGWRIMLIYAWFFIPTVPWFVLDLFALWSIFPHPWSHEITYLEIEEGVSFHGVGRKEYFKLKRKVTYY